MKTPRNRPTPLATWVAAADRADRAPAERLPCPGCAASVKGANLAEHVRRVHMADERAPRSAGRPVLVGLDRRLRTTGRRLLLGWALALLGLVQSSPDVIAEAAAGVATDPAAGEPTLALVRAHLGATGRTTIGAVLLAGLVLGAAAVVLGRAGRFRARVEVDGRTLVLHHRLGTGTRRVALPASVASGALTRTVGGSGGDETGSGGGPAETRRIGTYLRIGAGHRAITVGCPTSTKVRRHWDGLATGRERARWDVTLTPADFVALQYALAEAGALVPRVSAMAG